MTPITRTSQTPVTARRRAAAHRAAEGTLTAYLRDITASAHARPEPASARLRIRAAAPRPSAGRAGRPA